MRLADELREAMMVKGARLHMQTQKNNIFSDKEKILLRNKIKEEAEKGNHHIHVLTVYENDMDMSDCGMHPEMTDLEMLEAQESIKKRQIAHLNGRPAEVKCYLNSEGFNIYLKHFVEGDLCNSRRNAWRMIAEW